MKKNKTLILILGILLAAAVVVGLVFGVKALLNKGNEPATGEPVNTGESGSTAPTEEVVLDPTFDPVRVKDVYTVEDITSDDPRLDTVVAECGDFTLTNRQAQILYYMQYTGLLDAYGSYVTMFGLDPYTALYRQGSFMPGLTWEQAFLYAGITQNLGFTQNDVPAFQILAAMATRANEEGVTISEEDQANMDLFIEQMEAAAPTYGYADATEMIQAEIGASATLDDYMYFERLYTLAITYDNAAAAAAQTSEPTEEELQAYYEAHPETFADIDPDYTVNVRHILVPFDLDADGTATDAENAEAKDKAQQLLDEYLTDPTEEHFAALANEHSTDDGSNTKGGLYENVLAGKMVETFNDWCFDASRETADTGIVESQYGYHIMYYVGRGEEAWKSIAREAIRSEQAAALLTEICEAYPLTVRYEDVVLAPLALPAATE